MGMEASVREAQRASAEGEDREEKVVEVGLTSSGGVSGRAWRERASYSERVAIDNDMGSSFRFRVLVGGQLRLTTQHQRGR